MISNSLSYFVSLEGQRSPVPKNPKESILSEDYGIEIFSIKASLVKFKNATPGNTVSHGLEASWYLRNEREKGIRKAGKNRIVNAC